MDNAPAYSRERQFETIGRIAANIAHDWNNLLTILAAQISDLEEQIPEGHSAKIAAANVERTLALAARSPRILLSLVTGDVLDSSLVDCSRLLQDANPLLAAAAGRSVRLEISLSEDLPPVKVNDALLLHAVLNLLVNAREVTAPGRVITLRTYLHQNRTAISVSDEGPGMSEEVRLRVFDPFFSTKGRSGGTGLGLQTVNVLCKLYQVEAEVESILNQGTTFRLLFPANG